MAMSKAAKRAARRRAASSRAEGANDNRGGAIVPFHENRNRTNAAEAEDILEFFGSDDTAYLSELRRRAKEDGPLNCVYFARMGKTAAVKVGMSQFGLPRLKLLQTGSPLPVSFVGYVNFVDESAMAKAEEEAHRLCRERLRHLRLEWFSMTDEDVADIAKLLIGRDRKAVVGAAWAKGSA